MVFILGVDSHIQEVINILHLNKTPIDGVYDDIVKTIPNNTYPVIGTINDALIDICPDNSKVICGTSDNELRKEINDKFKYHTFINVISPYSIVNTSALMGSGNFIGHFVNILDNCKIGDHNIIYESTFITSYIDIGSYNTIGSNCIINGKVTINDMNKIGQNTNITPKLRIGKNNIISESSRISRDITNNQVILSKNPLINNVLSFSSDNSNNFIA